LRAAAFTGVTVAIASVHRMASAAQVTMEETLLILRDEAGGTPQSREADDPGASAGGGRDHAIYRISGAVFFASAASPKGAGRLPPEVFGTMRPRHDSRALQQDRGCGAAWSCAPAAASA